MIKAYFDHGYGKLAVDFGYGAAHTEDVLLTDAKFTVGGGSRYGCATSGTLGFVEAKGLSTKVPKSTRGLTEIKWSQDHWTDSKRGAVLSSKKVFEKVVIRGKKVFATV